jgi:hypothetical protein
VKLIQADTNCSAKRCTFSARGVECRWCVVMGKGIERFFCDGAWMVR